MDYRVESGERGYFGHPILKTPVWRWEVWSYFFLGGLAAGSYVVASLALLFGDSEDRPISRAGYALSAGAILACPALLIKDLGRPERFLNMLRAFKIGSPMSMGVWGLLGFSGCAMAMLARQLLADRDGRLGAAARLIPLRSLAIAGTALGCFLGSYTGVLLSATSVPLWSRSRLLGATFLASAFSSGLSAISLLLSLRSSRSESARRHLESAKRAALAAETMALLGYLRDVDWARRPLTEPAAYGRPFKLGAVGLGLVIPALATLGGPPRSRVVSALVALSGLAGGLLLRYALVEAGRASTRDPGTYLQDTDKPR